MGAGLCPGSVTGIIIGFMSLYAVGAQKCFDQAVSQPCCCSPTRAGPEQDPAPAGGRHWWHPGVFLLRGC